MRITVDTEEEKDLLERFFKMITDVSMLEALDESDTDETDLNPKYQRQVSSEEYQILSQSFRDIIFEVSGPVQRWTCALGCVSLKEGGVLPFSCF